jgi:predicted CopG family antitoxin
MTTASSERRKRLKLKRIVISERNYFALKELGHAGDSFNDVISKLLRIERSYQEIIVVTIATIMDFFSLRALLRFLISRIGSN